MQYPEISKFLSNLGAQETKENLFKLPSCTISINTGDKPYYSVSVPEGDYYSEGLSLHWLIGVLIANQIITSDQVINSKNKSI